jgi:hypothetical protein
VRITALDYCIGRMRGKKKEMKERKGERKVILP